MFSQNRRIVYELHSPFHFPLLPDILHLKNSFSEAQGAMDAVA